MAINRTIDLLPEYFRTIANQRFLSSTLDRLASDPALRNFDGYVGRKFSNGRKLEGTYVTEPSTFRDIYQLEPEYVFTESGTTAKSSGFLGLYRISSKNRHDISSAMERQVVGWPEPALVVIFKEWMRKRLAIFSKASFSQEASIFFFKAI